MAAVDTNVLVRLLAEDDVVQVRKAESFLRGNRPLWVCTVVLIETCWVLTSNYKWPKSHLVAALRALQDSSDFVLQAPTAVRAALNVFDTARADFAECLALELARAEGQLPFATFDRDAGRLPGASAL